jgi:hypothetical protein
MCHKNKNSKSSLQRKNRKLLVLFYTLLLLHSHTSKNVFVGFIIYTFLPERRNGSGRVHNDDIILVSMMAEGAGSKPGYPLIIQYSTDFVLEKCFLI